MAYDKAVNSAELDSCLDIIAAALRAKAGTSESLRFPDDFVSLIESIQTGGGGVEFASGSLLLLDDVVLSKTTPYSITHGLGKVPDFAIVVPDRSPSGTKTLAIALFVREALDILENKNIRIGLSYCASYSSTNGSAACYPDVAKKIDRQYGCIADDSNIQIYGDQSNIVSSSTTYCWIVGVFA